MKLALLLFSASWLTSVGIVLAADTPSPRIDMSECLHPSAIKPLTDGSIEIAGKAALAEGDIVSVRVTTSLGATFESPVKIAGQRFVCRYPHDFSGAPPLSPSLLYVDATDAPEFGGSDMVSHLAEVLIIVSDKEHALPDLPQGFTDDLIDAGGHLDSNAAQWPEQRVLVNLFMHSRAANLAHVGRNHFDLSTPEDFVWFKQHLTLYDFEHRDRDWRQHSGNRVARGFWQASWSTWFNAGNDHLSDGHYQPYTFTNDLADLLVLHQMRRTLPKAALDHRDELCREALANLLALQNRTPENFALKEADGTQEQYTAGAFRYGMFSTGEWLTEGMGWFANPKNSDFRGGGVFNGRAVWALGESLKADPQSALAPQVRNALALAIRFCLHDGLARHYAREVKPGLVIWRDPGEQGYLLLGMLAACETDPTLQITLADGEPAQSLNEVCANALDALAAAVKPSGTWTPYPDQDAMAIAALATGASVLPAHPHRADWLHTAITAADDWMAARSDPAERKGPTPNFGFRKGKGMTHYMGVDHHVRFTLYVTGHWIHALAKLHALTKDPRYLTRCQEMLRYLCGDNPFRVRLLNELGAVYNFVRDTDGDGVEDALNWDAYPESTAFVQIGLIYLLKL